MDLFNTFFRLLHDKKRKKTNFLFFLSIDIWNEQILRNSQVSKQKQSHKKKILCFLLSWLVLLGFNATWTAKVTSRRSVTRICFLAFSYNKFLSKATYYFSHMHLQRWYAKIHRKESCLYRGSNSQPTGHGSNTLTTEPPERGLSF